MTFFFIILLWQHICTLFLVQGGKWTGYSQFTCLPARETGYAATTILLRKVHILTRDFS